MIIDNVNVTINVAATIDFDMPLKDSIPINIGGAMNNLELAKACKKLLIYCHISTAYANSEQPSGSRIKEQVYDYGVDVIEMIEKIKKLPEDQLLKDTPKILGAYPNTYTFTKSNAERILKLTRGSLPVVIVRPSIIGCSQAEPAPGWVDSLAAAAAYVHAIGIGIANHTIGDPNVVIDLVPVDYVCNAILLSCAF